MPTPANPTQEDIVRSLDRLTAAAGQNTHRNTALPQPQLAPAIPARTGSVLSAAPTN